MLPKPDGSAKCAAANSAGLRPDQPWFDKAIRAGQGLPLEVFVGDDLQDLRLISHNWTKLSVPGFAGSIRLRVKAGRTYHFRTDLVPGNPRP